LGLMPYVRLPGRRRRPLGRRRLALRWTTAVLVGSTVHSRGRVGVRPPSTVTARRGGLHDALQRKWPRPKPDPSLSSLCDREMAALGACGCEACTAA
jgi:hypothetical protein